MPIVLYDPNRTGAHPNVQLGNVPLREGSNTLTDSQVAELKKILEIPEFQERYADAITMPGDEAPAVSPSAPPSGNTNIEIPELDLLSAEEAIAKIGQISDAPLLQMLLEEEQDSKKRKTVLEAIRAKLAEIKPTEA